MTSRRRITLDRKADTDIVQAEYSTLTKKPAKVGRPQTRLAETRPVSTPVEYVPEPTPFDENVPLPQYPGDASAAEIDENIANVVYTYTKSQNDYLREWLPRRQDQLNAILELEGRNNPGGLCEECSTAAGEWRCWHCLGKRMLCSNCLWKEHRFQPYHRVEQWKGTFFRDGALWEVGIQICLGHKGYPCPNKSNVAAPGHKPNIGDGGTFTEAAVTEDMFEDTGGDPDLPEEDQAGDGDEDDGIYEGVEANPIEVPKVPSVDSGGNPFICIVDTTGIHYLPVVSCMCSTVDNNLEYIRVGLFPASFTKVKTAFTVDVLRDYRLTNLECKTSAYQYYQKLRRLTAPAFPKSVINRYRELRRLSRQYRNMKLWKIHGKIYDEQAAEAAPPEIQQHSPVPQMATVATTPAPPGLERDTPAPPDKEPPIPAPPEVQPAAPPPPRRTRSRPAAAVGGTSAPPRLEPQATAPPSTRRSRTAAVSGSSLAPPEVQPAAPPPPRTRSRAAAAVGGTLAPPGLGPAAPAPPELEQGAPSPQGQTRSSTTPAALGGTPGPPPQRNQRGTLALFCAACPQPGINLPEDWQSDPDKKLYTRSLVADGNFKADQLNLKNQDDDVHLTHGEAFMTASKPYQAHLREAEKLAPRYKATPTCHNHHANADADKAVVGKRVRGVGAHACARHGCFCPSSVVDFTKGEKQMHMDWSLIQAIATTHMDEIIRLLHLYDVNCQYAINLLRRIAESSHMTMPDKMEIVSGIGLFHVHGHKDECLYRYASTYIPDVGIIDGEVMETLWAVLNLTSPSTRGATIAHRTEVLDDHMGDSNWKKIINTPYSIGKRYTRALAEEASTGEYFDGLSASVPENFRVVWQRDIEAAEAKRDGDPAVMDLMQSKNKKAPSRKDIELALGTKELREKAKTGSAAWIAQGLQLEYDQLELRSFVRKLGRKPTTAQKLDLLKKRRKMRNKVEKYIATTSGFLDAGALHYLNNDETAITDPDPMDDEWADADNPTITWADPERQKLPFPSGLGQEFLQKLSPETLARVEGFRQVEVQVRMGQANDCLENIRNDLIQLSWQYRNQVRVHRSQSTKTRAWAGVNLLNNHWRLQRLLYNINRFAMIAAGNETEINKKYLFLDLSECVASTALDAPNVPGHTTRQMNWIWIGVGSLDGDLGENDYAREFWRVNWLTARSVHNRWEEEIKLTLKEMQWTVGFYSHMAQEWIRRRDQVPRLSEGHRAYAARKVHMWAQLASVAQQHFDKLLT